MAANIFGRYVWLIDTIRRHKRITYEEINNLWMKSGLSYGEGDELPLRTFHNHRKAIKDIFDVYIECDIKGGYKYYIENPESLDSDGLRTWLIDNIQKVVIKAYWYARKYLDTLPIHSSQKLLTQDDESSTYEYYVRPNYDFIQALLCQADQIEVLEPEWVRVEMKRMAENMLSYYKTENK